MAASVSLGVIGLFKLYLFSWFNFGIGTYPKLSIYFTFSNFVEYRFSKYDLVILCISSVSVVMFPFSFLILIIWMLSLWLLVSLDKGLSIWLIFLKNQLCFIDSLYFLCFYFIDFSLQYNYLLLYTPPGWVFFFLL